MDPNAWTEAAKTLGVSAPLVAILIYLLKQSTEERKEITSSFLSTLQQALDGEVGKNNEVMRALTVSLDRLEATVTEHRSQSREEHTRLLDYIMQTMKAHKGDT